MAMPSKFSTHIMRSRSGEFQIANLLADFFKIFNLSNWHPDLAPLAEQLNEIIFGDSSQESYQKAFENLRKQYPDAQGIFAFIHYVSKNIASLVPNEEERMQEKGHVFNHILSLMKVSSYRLANHAAIEQKNSDIEQKNSDWIVDPSPAVILNVVCSALMGGESAIDEAYAAVGSNNDADKSARIIPLWNILYDFSKSQPGYAEQNQGMLFLLDGVFPVKNKSNNNYERLQLIEDWSGFLIGAISAILSRALKETHQDKERLLLGKTRDWINIDSIDTNKKSAVLKSLKRQTTRVRDDLLGMIAEKGYSISTAAIENCLDQIEFMRPTEDIDPSVPGLLEIASLPLTTVSSNDIRLVQARNQALRKVKGYIASASSFSGLDERVKRFLEAERSVQRVIKYDKFKVFVEEDSPPFSSARKTLIAGLLSYLEGINAGRFDTQIDIANSRSAFNQAEKDFQKARPNVRLLRFFAMASENQNRPDIIDREWAYLRMRFHDELYLSDISIADLLEHDKKSDDSFNLNENQIALVLVHAVSTLESNQPWTAKYTALLAATIRHLTHSSQAGYPAYLVYNLEVAMIMRRVDLPPDNIKKVWGQSKGPIFHGSIFPVVNKCLTARDYECGNLLATLIDETPLRTSKQLHDLQKLRYLTYQQRERIWDRIPSAQLDEWASTVTGFLPLITSLGLTHKRYQDVLWPRFKDKLEDGIERRNLKDLIPAISVLMQLFDSKKQSDPRADRQLQAFHCDLAPHKQDIFDCCAHHFKSVTTVWCNQLVEHHGCREQWVILELILSGDISKFSPKEIGHMCMALTSSDAQKRLLSRVPEISWGGFVCNFGEIRMAISLLGIALSLYSSEKEKLDDIVKIIKLEKLIKTTKDFCELWELVGSFVDPVLQDALKETLTYRHLHEFLENNAKTLIGDGDDLVRLLELPGFNVNDWGRLISADLISSATHLCSILSSRKIPTDSDLRNHIWQSKKSELRDLIRNGTELYQLLSLPPDKRIFGQHNDIWQSITTEQQLAERIKNMRECYQLLTLPPDALAASRRPVIWSIISKSFARFIRSVEDIDRLLTLLATENRSAPPMSIIIKKIKNINFNAVIKNATQLIKLLSTYAVVDLRVEILNAVRGNFVRFFQKPNEVYDFFRFAAGGKLSKWLTIEEIWMQIQTRGNFMSNFIVDILDALLRVPVSDNLRTMQVRTIIEKLPRIVTYFAEMCGWQEDCRTVMRWPTSNSFNPHQKELFLRALRDYSHLTVVNSQALNDLIVLAAANPDALSVEIVDKALERLDVNMSHGELDTLLNSPNLTFQQKNNIFHFAVTHFNTLVLYSNFDLMRLVETLLAFFNAHPEGKDSETFGACLIANLPQIIDHSWSMVHQLSFQLQKDPGLQSSIHQALWQHLEKQAQEGNKISLFIRLSSGITFFLAQDNARLYKIILPAQEELDGMSAYQLQTVIRFGDQVITDWFFRYLKPSTIKRLVEEKNDLLHNIFRFPLGTFSIGQRLSFWDLIPNDTAFFSEPNTDFDEPFTRFIFFAGLPESQLPNAILIGVFQNCREVIKKLILQSFYRLVSFMLRDRLPSEQRDEMWNEVCTPEYIKNNVTDITDLYEIYNCSLDQVSIEKRQYIWRHLNLQNLAIGDDCNFEILCDFANLSPEQFSQDFFEALVAAMESSVSSEWIEPCSDDKMEIFLRYYRAPRLSEGYRARLFGLLLTALQELDRTGDNEYCYVDLLFAFPLFSAQQREAIWCKLENKVALIEFNYCRLFDLPLSRLSPERRQLILTQRQDQIIYTGDFGPDDELWDLYNLSLEKFTATQRDRVWDKVRPFLTTLIKDGTQLARLFSLSPQKFSTEKRKDSWDMLKFNLLNRQFLTVDGLKFLIETPANRIFAIQDGSMDVVMASFITATLKSLDSVKPKESGIYYELYGSARLPAGTTRSQYCKKMIDENGFMQVGIDEYRIIPLLSLIPKIKELPYYKKALWSKLKDSFVTIIRSRIHDNYIFFRELTAALLTYDWKNPEDSDIATEILTEIDSALPLIDPLKKCFVNVFRLPLNEGLFKKFWDHFMVQLSNSREWQEHEALANFLELLSDESRLQPLQRIQIENKLLENFDDLIYTLGRVVTFLRLYDLLVHSEHPRREDCLRALVKTLFKPTHGYQRIVANASNLFELLSASILPEQTKQEIWLFFQGQLVTLIEDGAQLAQLLSISELPSQVILDAVGSRLSFIIKNFKQLYALLTLTTLTQAQQIEILIAIRDNLDILIENEEQQEQLFNLPTIKSVCRASNDTRVESLISALKARSSLSSARVGFSAVIRHSVFSPPSSSRADGDRYLEEKKEDSLCQRQ